MISEEVHAHSDTAVLSSHALGTQAMMRRATPPSISFF
jgi:hypothetical protein